MVSGWEGLKEWFCILLFPSFADASRRARSRDRVRTGRVTYVQRLDFGPLLTSILCPPRLYARHMGGQPFCIERLELASYAVNRVDRCDVAE
jgi:hypothetical protein